MPAADIGFCELLCSYDDDEWAVILVGSAWTLFPDDVVKMRRRVAFNPSASETRPFASSVDLGVAALDLAGLVIFVVLSLGSTVDRYMY